LENIITQNQIGIVEANVCE